MTTSFWTDDKIESQSNIDLQVSQLILYRILHGGAKIRILFSSGENNIL